MALPSTIVVCLLIGLSQAGKCPFEEKTYNYQTGKPATDEEISFFKSIGQTNNCTTKIALPCKEDDWRRIDGSCNNLNDPARGTFSTPMYRMLPAHFHDGNKHRLAVSGEPLVAERIARLTCLQTGKSISQQLSVAAPGFGIFMYGDTGSTHDIERYVIYERDCCKPEHMNDDICTPLIIADDDPVHRFSGIRCMNGTRPVYYQDRQCTDDPVPSPVADSSQAYDMSMVYNNKNQGDKPLRTMEGGELITEVINGAIWPKTGDASPCFLNEDYEKICFAYQRNALLSIQLLNILFVRLHNYFAKSLAKVNPDWDDETLFQTARDMVIATSQQMFVYEWMEAFIGRENLNKAGLTYNHDGHRDIYDNTIYPQVSVEYSFGLRFFHIMQETKAKLYDSDGSYIEEIPLVNKTFRTGWLALNNNLRYTTQNFFRQPTRAFDHSADADLSEQGLGGLQRAEDTMAFDLSKTRGVGLAPYIDYVKHCSGKKIKTFEHLSRYNLITPERVELLKEIYDDVRDIDLLVGLWLEEPIEGGLIPRTLSCILVDNVLTSIKADRHHYERPNRPHAFNKAQLKEIRKSTLALMLCNVGDRVYNVQPKAMKRISPENPLTPCEELPQIDFTAWADSN